MPRGGRRPGSGRKPKSNYQRAIDGTLARVLEHPSAPPTTNEASPVEEFDAPDDLEREPRLIWLKQAPHAFRNGTLTRGTALSFERYCKIVVMERKEGESSAQGGANHRGLLKQINAYELQYLLTPCGKRMPDAGVSQPAESVSKLSRFRK